MFTSLLALKIAGIVITTEQLVSAGFAAFFLTSEALANNPKVKANSIYQFMTGYLKSVRKEDDKIKAIKKVINQK